MGEPYVGDIVGVVSTGFLPSFELRWKVLGRLGLQRGPWIKEPRRKRRGSQRPRFVEPTPRYGSTREYMRNASLARKLKQARAWFNSN